MPPSQSRPSQHAAPQHRSAQPSSSQQRSPQQSAIPTAIPIDRLNLSQDDVATLRRHQQLAHQNNNASSSAGSQASSQGRLLLDPGSLQLLSRHFDRVMQAIGQRLEQVSILQIVQQRHKTNTPINSSTKRPRSRPKLNTTARVMLCRWPMLRSHASERSCNRSTS